MRFGTGTAVAAGLAGGVLTLTGCGAGVSADSTGAGAAEPVVTSPAPSEAEQADPGARGAPDAEALSDLDCVQRPSGAWSASATLTNTTGEPADFVVTVAVAGPEQDTVRATRQRVRGLAAGDSADLVLRRLPAPGGDELSCQVQVTRR